jgi:ribosomal-protein-serine acetyltransferase
MEIDLRAWTEDDAPALNEAVTESLEHLRPWMPWVAGEPIGLDARRAWIREGHENADRVFGIWVDGEVAGGCGFHDRIGPGALEIGYWVHAGFVRRGIATAVVRRLCEMAFEDPAIERLEIHHDRANVASGRVAAAAGFDYVREQRDEQRAPADSGIEWVWQRLRGA